MINEELLQYIKGERGKGIPADKIAADLVAGGGWGRSDVDEAFRVLNQQYLFPQKKKQAPSITTNPSVSAQFAKVPPVSVVDNRTIPSMQPQNRTVESPQQVSEKVNIQSVSKKESFGLGATILLLAMILISGLLIFFYFRFA